MKTRPHKPGQNGELIAAPSFARSVVVLPIIIVALLVASAPPRVIPAGPVSAVRTRDGVILSSSPSAPDRPDLALPADGTPGARRARRRGGSPAPWANRIVGHADVAPSELVANPANWRRHPARQQRALAGAIAEAGLVAGVTVNRRTGRLVDGHLRLELALARGEATLPVTFIDVSLEEEQLILATLDPLGAMAEADTATLAQLLAGVTPADADLAAMLADLADRYRIANSGLVDPDLVPPLPADEELYVQAGDAWQLDDHRIMCGDATNPADVERLLAGQEPTLLATDAPYGVKLDLTARDRVGGRPALRPAPRDWSLHWASGGRCRRTGHVGRRSLVPVQCRAHHRRPESFDGQHVFAHRLPHGTDCPGPHRLPGGPRHGLEDALEVPGGAPTVVAIDHPVGY